MITKHQVDGRLFWAAIIGSHNIWDVDDIWDTYINDRINDRIIDAVLEAEFYDDWRDIPLHSLDYINFVKNHRLFISAFRIGNLYSIRGYEMIGDDTNFFYLEENMKWEKETTFMYLPRLFLEEASPVIFKRLIDHDE